MSGLAFYKRLRAAGVDEATAVLCAEAFDAEVKLAVAALLEPRRAKDRARKASKVPRNSAEDAETAEFAEIHVAPPSRPLPPRTPPTPTQPPECVTSRTRGEAFERFWKAYPRKEAKKTAKTRFDIALTKVSPDVLMAAVERQRTWEQWQRGFVPHAATWLHQERWQDEDSAAPEPQARKAHERPHHDAKHTARQANRANADAGAYRASGQRFEP